jgi:hypothetical protein
MIRRADKTLKEKWAETFNALPVDSKKALKAALNELSKDARKRSSYSWNKHKAPMALYWKVVSVYAGHILRSIKL